MTNRLFQKRTLVLLASLSLCGALTVAWLVKQRAERSLAAERSRLAKQNFVPFEHKYYAQINNAAISVWQSYKTTRAIERFNDSIFVATDGGLVQFGPTGNFVRHYSVLDGLPESDLLSLATFNSKLFIGTRTSGLVAFDGDRFEGYRWTDRVSQSIDALLSDSGRLLIGTRAGGLIAFDGSQFTELKAGGEDERLLAINFLAKNGAALFVGTFSSGLWTEQAARWSHFTTADGLLSNRIVGIAADDENLFVASDYGLATAPLTSLNTAEPPQGQPRFLSVAVVPSLSSIVQYGDELVLCKDNSETLGLRPDVDLSHARRTIPATWNKVTAATGSKLATLDRDLWLLSNDGVHRAVVKETDRGNMRFSRWGEFRQSLTSNLISALSVDSQGRVWAGTFRNGIDVLGPSGTMTAHLESESVREINSLVEDATSKKMLAASSAGLLSFNPNLGTTEQLSVADGLLSNSIMQVTYLSDPNRQLDRSMLVLATSKGLSLGAKGNFRGLTTVQGLPSNNLYSVLGHAGKLYVATLGGLAVLEGGRVYRVFKDTNSKLTPNWVTALCAVGPRVFVGTYGGGVFELTTSGELRSFSSEIGRAVVNPNAMWSDGSRLYVGTLEGTLVFDLNTQEWLRLNRELPARMVLSIAGDEKYVYFGTTAGIARIEHRYWTKNT
ncbi:MAG TPA: two-component regulator propeller domain-containing protein [Pyrinomonadaceae bacterium]|nr:two-component regulator propeller domain-containing protein [Pyrinomonadaceae bacterium]